MKISHVLAAAVFIAVLGVHVAWNHPSQSDGLSASSPESTEECTDSQGTYVSSGAMWLGLSYASAGAFAAFCLGRLYLDRKAALAGTVGGLTLGGFVYVVACFMLGCCGSPMLGVYGGLLGPRFLGFAKPLLLVITLASIAIGYICIIRRKACSSAGSCCPEQEGDRSSEGLRGPEPWMRGYVETAAGRIPRPASALSFADRVGSAKARWGIRRMRYTVQPRLYALGQPTAESVVLVTANYKMSFDRLRSELAQIDAWIMVLDTKGINVWCAAGKGTFGTEEIIERVRAVRLGEIVSHRRLILPQLAGPGVSAHKVKSACGFEVVYGPIRAQDLPAFLAAGMKATAQMRKVRFDLADRVVLIPMELRMSSKYLLVVAVGLFLLGGLGADGYSWDRTVLIGLRSVLILAAAYVVGAVVPVALLPWLPGRAFSVKGMWVGLPAGLAVVGYSLNNPGVFASRLSAGGWFFMLVAVASFMAMNFTGASTYTSLSGVRREVRIAGPIQALCGLLGLGLWVAERFA